MIRKFKKRDANQCSKLILECINESLDLNEKNKQFMIENNQPEKVIEKTKNRDLYVQETNGKIIGIGALTKNEIRTIFVKPKSQKKNFGTRMIDFLTKKAKKAGFDKVWTKAAPSAEEFYKKQGFKKIKIIKHPDFKTIKMEKKI